MKNLNLIKRLWDDSHEKQSPQRFARYAAILIMLLTLGVGQMWATTVYYVNRNSWSGVKIHYWGGTGSSSWDSRPSMTKTGYKVNGFDVYSYNIGNNNTLIFMDSNNESNRDGGDVSFSDSSKPYYFAGWYASWAACWQVKGSYDSWAGTACTSTGNNTGRVTVNLTADTEFKLYCLANSNWYGSNGGTIPDNTSWTLNGSENTSLAHTHNGNYVFDIDFSGSNPSVKTHAPYQVSYAAGTGATGTVSASAVTTYGSTCTLSSSTFSKTGYTQDGWATSDGGAKVYELGGSYTAYVDVTLYPHWSENMSSVSLVSSPASKGSFTIGGAAATSTTAGVTTTRSVTAVPISGYHFVSWAITGGATISSTSTNPTTVTGKGAGESATLTATFAADDVYSLTVAAGTGISAVTGSTNDIKAGDNIAITATVATGYTWSTWTKTGSGSLSTFTAGTKNQTVTVGTAGDMTLTASATENKSSLTTSNHYDAGNPSYSVPSKSVSSIGIVTTADLTAATPSTGYRFAGWTLSNNIVVTSGDEDTDLSITIRTNGNGAAATAQANYEEVLTSNWHIIGEPNTIIPNGWTANDDNMLMKASGSSTSSAGSLTINVKTLPANSSDYQFKVYNDNTDTPYGWSNEDYYWVNATSTTGVYSSDSHPLYFIPNALGEYTFAVNWSSNPSLTVTFPTSYAVNFGQGSGTAGSASATYSSTSFSTGTKVQNGKSITLTAPSASSGYSWDGWYNASSGGTRVSTSNPLTTTISSSNHDFYARYTEATYTVAFNDGDHGTVSPSGDQQVGAGGKNITAYPSAGYMFSSWSKTGANVTLSSTSTNPTTVTAAGTGSVTANYEQRFVLRGSKNTGGDPAGGMAGWSATNNDGYESFSVAGNVITIEASLEASTEYKFKIWDKQLSAWRGQDGSSSMSDGDTWTFNNDDDVFFTTTFSGTYTFTIDISTATAPSVTLSYPPAHTLTYSIGSVSGTDGSISTSPSTASGSLVEEGHTVTLTAPAAKTGYTWKGWYTNAAGTEGKIDDTNRAITVTMDADKTLYACYTENSYSTNVAVSPAAKGSITTPTPSEGKISVSHHTGTSVTATAITNYVFDHWAVSGGGLTVSSTTTNPATFKATSANGTITAYFEDQWCLKGDQWGSWSTSKGLPNTAANTFSASFTLTKGQKYKFKVHDRKTNTWYGNTKDAGEHAMERGDAAYGTVTNGGNDDNLTITPDVTGDYTFSFNTSTNKITVTYPTAYTVTFGAGTINGSDAAITASASPSFSSGDYVLPETDITFSKGETKDGYTWKGWYSDQAGSATLHEDDDDDFTWSATRTGNISVYACYNFITYDITYNLNSGTNHPSNPATFNVETSTITLQNPTRTGYTFGGWYDNSSLTGDAVTTIAKGTHEDQELWAKWTAKTYTITLNQNGATTESDPTSLTATYDGRANGASDVFTLTNPEKTGYTFNGWYESAGGTGAEIITTAKYYKWEDNPYVTTTGLWQHDGDVTVYAKWTANSYTVTLSASGETGYGGSAGTGSVSATYDASMPAIASLPTPAPGYKFMGYFLGQNGTGVQYYDASGASVINWNRAEATTLYAYFRKTEISSLEHPASIANDDVITLDVNPVFNQTGARDYMEICWSLLYADNDNPVESGVAIASNPAVGKPNQVRFTLTGISAGYYKVQAVLKANATSFDGCSTGTELMTIKSDLRISGNSKVTIQYEDANGNTIRDNDLVEVARGDSIGIKAPSIIGYTFTEWTLGDVLSNSCNNSATCGLDKDSINIKAEYDGVLIAQYTKKDIIYFNNTLGWENVYVYFYSSDAYWDGSKGTGAQYDKTLNSKQAHYRHFWGEMTKIGTSNIYYFDYQAAAAVIDPENASEINGYTYVAFTKDAQGYTDEENKGYEFFYETEVVRRGDFAHSKSMFVPLTSPTTLMNSDKTTYYDQGYWMNYPESTGYTLKIYNDNSSGDLKKELVFTFPADKKMPMSITTDLEADKTYGFKIVRADGNEYGNNGTMTNGLSGDGVQGVWEFKTGKNRAGLTTNSAGDYTFTLSYGVDLESNYNYLVGVHYPEATGDFRVQYKDNDHTNWRTSVVIPADSERDTVSYFVRRDETPYIRAQKCTATYDDERDPKTVVEWNNESSGANIISSLPSAITEDGVYNFIFTKSDGALVLEKVEPYEGNFYIRVDGAGSSNWDNFRAADHLMPYSDYSFHQATNPYSHYFMEWREVKDRAHLPNIKFVVANDYSVCISDTIAQDGIANNYVDANGYLNRDANIRFMYNYKTNEATRRYIDGAYAGGGDFLTILSGDSKIAVRNHDDTADSTISVLKFSDNGNWIYEANVKAKPGAQYKLKSTYGKPSSEKPDENGEVIQYFKGGESSTETLIGGSGSSYYQIRLLYDFKTNRVVAAYMPSGTIEDDLAINADIMFMREHQGDVEQITFASGRKISEIENIYCGLRFNKWTLNNKSKEGLHPTLPSLLSRYERDIFYVSFPYDVRLSDVIGFGTYGQHWIVEYYDGAARAKEGFWIDSETFWKFVTPAMKDTFTLKAGTGYIVALDLDELYYIDATHHASIWDNTDIQNLELLFPGDISTISEQTVTYNVPKHTCTINRGEGTTGDRRVKDSHWNVLGVPTFKNITGVETVDGGGSGGIVFTNTAWIKDTMNLKFIYDGNLADNSLTPKAVKGFEFKAMHGYVVQYGGDVTFTTSATPAPSPIVARSTYADKPVDVDFRIELSKNGVMEDQTFISLSNDENASTGFAFGEDLSKEFNTQRANIYTFIGTEWAAGNTLPMSNQTTVIPVGVKTPAAGEYTFAIPDGTAGVGVTLIDNETGIHTNLGLMDYTVTLGQGQIDNRFVIEISPIANVPTDIDETSIVNRQSSNRKLLIDDILYIVKDGKVFDATGRQVK